MASAFCNAGKKALFDGKVGDTWKAALYTSAASLDATTAAYSSTNELASSGGYSAGGLTLSGAATGSDSGGAWITFSNATWANATFTGAHYMLIYDSSDSNRAYAVIDFGSDKAGQGGNFTYVMPATGSSTAIIRL
jgi:hypothetical protein